MKLKDKVSLITGAGSGIGRAIATLFAREGARVIANDLNEKAARETVEALGAAGSGARAIRADVADSAQVKAMFAEVEPSSARSTYSSTTRASPAPRPPTATSSASGPTRGSWSC